MNAAHPADAWVALLADDDRAPALTEVLRQAGMATHRLDERTETSHVGGEAHADGVHAPQALVLGLPLAAAAAEPGAPWPWDLPVIAIGPAAGGSDDDLADRLAALGAHAWLARLDPADWARALAFARAAHRREQALRQRIVALQADAVEQRLVARAKGVLMAAQGLTEGEAFALLRGGAMQTRLPMGDVARAVVDTAIWAEAVNRAGQLRWLSQRCVAAAAQRLARVDPPAARKVQQQALKRAREILDALARLPLPDELRATLAAADSAWSSLRTGLAQRLDLASLAAADRQAEAALASAEALTGALQRAGSRPMLRVVNLCGRQRMRAQRLVKFGLLARLGSESGDAARARDEALALMDGFAQTLAELAQLPLGSGEISAAHRRAEDRWRHLGHALRSGDAALLVQDGEALLDSLDNLTGCWERSLHVLMA